MSRGLGGEHLHESDDRGDPRIVVRPEIEDGAALRAERGIRTRAVRDSWNGAERQPPSRGMHSLWKTPGKRTEWARPRAAGATNGLNLGAGSNCACGRDGRDEGGEAARCA